MDHPDFPTLSPSVQKGAIAGVFCGFYLQSRPSDELALQKQKANQLQGSATPSFGPCQTAMPYVYHTRDAAPSMYI